VSTPTENQLKDSFKASGYPDIIVECEGSIRAFVGEVEPDTEMDADSASLAIALLGYEERERHGKTITYSVPRPA
jgi:hypothetical protein